MKTESLIAFFFQILTKMGLFFAESMYSLFYDLQYHPKNELVS